MEDIWTSATRIEITMANSLALLERAVGTTGVRGSLSEVEAAIIDAWRLVVADVRAGAFDLSGVYLGRIHEQLTAQMGATPRTGFRDEGLDGSWKTFIDEMTSEYPPEEAWVLASLCNAEHVESFGLSFGWLVMNGVRLQRGEHAIYPPIEHHEELAEQLKWAGPDLWDAESLRATLGRYGAAQQVASMDSDSQSFG